MDQRKPNRIALLPIQPVYVNAILAGKKKVEFRRQRFAYPLEYVVVYATSPVKKVVAFFKVVNIFEDTPEAIWRKFKEVAGIDQEKYSAYFEGTNLAFAIEIGELEILKDPVPLSQFSGGLKAPQGFAYFSPSQFGQLRGVVTTPFSKDSECLHVAPDATAGVACTAG